MPIEIVNHQMAAMPKSKRVLRKPVHPFSIEFEPYQVQPFFIAPVLPGETMTNLLYQSKSISDLIKNDIIGWWYEVYFFYVKHRDLSISAELQAMVLDPTYDISAKYVAADVGTFHTANATPDGINFVQLCQTAVVDDYFRYEGEVASDHLISSVPCASSAIENWMDSLALKSVFDAQDFDADLDADATITAGEIEKALRIYQSLQAAGLTDQTYEDFLRQYGVNIPQSEIEGKTELLRYIRKWKTPSRLIDPADGSPVAQMQWDLTERADKNRLFKEPGFVFGVSVVRPKVYEVNHRGTVTSFMTDAYAWLPAMQIGDANTGIRTHEVGHGPLQASTAEYMYDIRDLLMYGEQFLNYVTTTTGKNEINLPVNGITNKRYPQDSDVDRLFVAASPANKIITDGVVTLSVKSQVQDLSATVA